jgi:pyruvate formate lyase activating enzyme
VSVLACGVCPHHCSLADGAWGRCHTRRGKDNNIDLPYRGFITAAAIDPIEKKPIVRWREGCRIPSFGFRGCNLHCPFCQNWEISQADCSGAFLSAKDLVERVKATGLKQVAYTYSEPLIHAEYLSECMPLARDAGIANVLVTNGCASKDTADALLPYVDAANIDLKCFDADKYKHVLGGDLQAVCRFIESALEHGVHVEVTTLVVPGFNDDPDEIARGVDYIASLSDTIDYHFSAYHPAWKYTAPPTSREVLYTLARRAKEKLRFVHLGNV